MATKVNLTPFVRGDVVNVELTISDSAGAPIDITDDVFWLTLKLDPTVEDAAADAQTSVTAAGAPAAAGEVTVSLLPAETDVLTPGANYYYDVQRVVSATDVQTIVYGRVKCLRDITREIA